MTLARTLSLACILILFSVAAEARTRHVDQSIPAFDRHAIHSGASEIGSRMFIRDAGARRVRVSGFKQMRRKYQRRHAAPVRGARVIVKSQDRVDAAPVKLASVDPQDNPAPSNNILERYRESIPAAPALPPVEAKRHGLVTLRTKSGQTYNVAAGAARSFSGFVAWLESTGYKITEIGGYAFRRIAKSNTISNHARGTAIDINQRYRNVVSRRFPVDVTAKAAEFGLSHGAVWRGRLGPDTGHFELRESKKFAVLGSGKAKHRHHRRVRLASR